MDKRKGHFYGEKAISGLRSVNGKLPLTNNGQMKVISCQQEQPHTEEDGATTSYVLTAQTTRSTSTIKNKTEPIIVNGTILPNSKKN